MRKEVEMDNAVHKYVHGYSRREIKRLVDQATTLAELLHSDTKYPAGASVLEAGCGAGAQTVTLVKNSPETHFTCVDISNEYLQIAKARVEATGHNNAHRLRRIALFVVGQTALTTMALLRQAI